MNCSLKKRVIAMCLTALTICTFASTSVSVYASDIGVTPTPKDGGQVVQPRALDHPDETGTPVKDGFHVSIEFPTEQTKSELVYINFLKV